MFTIFVYTFSTSAHSCLFIPKTCLFCSYHLICSIIAMKKIFPIPYLLYLFKPSLFAGLNLTNCKLRVLQTKYMWFSKIFVSFAGWHLKVRLFLSFSQTEGLNKFRREIKKDCFNVCLHQTKEEISCKDTFVKWVCDS